MSSLPVVDLSAPADTVAASIRVACVDDGFFYVANHGIESSLFARLEALSTAFFARPIEEKRTIEMAKGGAAWRGYFPVGGELTSGAPDRKEGLYFGEELALSDPRVVAGWPLHGPNLFPEPIEFRETVLATMRALTTLGHTIMRGIAESLALPADYLDANYTREPTVLFRIFHYPSARPDKAMRWGVGEHTDYGLLTILKQDDVGGLEVRSARGWIAAPPIPGTLLCNIGDMLERMTGGLYRSTPHRVSIHPERDRLSFPFFFDPAWNARIKPIELLVERNISTSAPRWDGASVFDFGGTYGEYLVAKVAKVFPELARAKMGL